MQYGSLRVYIADAFAGEQYAGNQAGVVILTENQDFPEDTTMRKIAGELKHSETAFVKRVDRDAFHIRYFTPVEEVELCGHATIASFAVLREQQMILPGTYELHTKAQQLQVQVTQQEIWMEMAAPKEQYTFTRQEAEELYGAYGISKNQIPQDMEPKIVSTGLSDILLPVASSEALNGAVQQCQVVEALSQNYQVVGVHMFCLSKKEKILAECRNFAPLYGIAEEAATGTANGALTYYLYGYHRIMADDVNTFLQGEAMGKPSYVKSRLKQNRQGDVTIEIGGNAVISLKGEMTYEN